MRAESQLLPMHPTDVVALELLCLKQKPPAHHLRDGYEYVMGDSVIYLFRSMVEHSLHEQIAFSFQLALLEPQSVMSIQPLLWMN